MNQSQQKIVEHIKKLLDQHGLYVREECTEPDSTVALTIYKKSVTTLGLTVAVTNTTLHIHNMFNNSWDNTDIIIQLSNPNAFQLLINKIIPMVDSMPKIELVDRPL